MTAKPQIEPTLAEMIARTFSTLDTEAPIDSGSASDELAAFHARLNALADGWRCDCNYRRGLCKKHELLAQLGVLKP